MVLKLSRLLIMKSKIVQQHSHQLTIEKNKKWYNQWSYKETLNNKKSTKVKKVKIIQSYLKNQQINHLFKRMKTFQQISLNKTQQFHMMNYHSIRKELWNNHRIIQKSDQLKKVQFLRKLIQRFYNLSKIIKNSQATSLWKSNSNFQKMSRRIIKLRRSKSQFKLKRVRQQISQNDIKDNECFLT